MNKTGVQNQAESYMIRNMVIFSVCIFVSIPETSIVLNKHINKWTHLWLECLVQGKQSVDMCATTPAIKVGCAHIDVRQRVVLM